VLFLGLLNFFRTVAGLGDGSSSTTGAFSSTTGTTVGSGRGVGAIVGMTGDVAEGVTGSTWTGTGEVLVLESVVRVNKIPPAIPAAASKIAVAVTILPG
jgi:hypothetical protein